MISRSYPIALQANIVNLMGVIIAWTSDSVKTKYNAKRIMSLCSENICHPSNTTTASKNGLLLLPFSLLAVV